MCKHAASTVVGHTCGTGKPPRQLCVGTHGTLHARAMCVVWRGVAWGVPRWVPGFSLLPSRAVGFGLVLGSSSAAFPLAVLRCRGGTCLGLCKIVSSPLVPRFGFAGSNGSLGFVLLQAGWRKRLIPQQRAQRAPRHGEAVGSGFGVVTALCAVPCSVVFPPPPRGDAPCHGCPFLLLWKSLRLRRRIPYIIHATASPGGWVTDGAHLPAPRCLTRGVPWEAGGSSRRAVPGLPARCPSAMPSGGTPAAEGATRGHVSCRNWVQVNTLPGQAVGLGASRRAGTCLVSARGIVSQGPAGAGA